MKDYDNMTEQEINALPDDLKAIAKIKSNLKKVREDHLNLYRAKNWTDAHHDMQQALMRQEDNLRNALEAAKWTAIKNCNGCIHLELASIKREKDNNSSTAKNCIDMIEWFANEITEIMQ